MNRPATLSEGARPALVTAQSMAEDAMTRLVDTVSDLAVRLQPLLSTTGATPIPTPPIAREMPGSSDVVRNIADLAGRINEQNARLRELIAMLEI